MTTLPFTYPIISSKLTLIGSLPKRSSISTSRSFAILTSPLINWYRPGSIFNIHFVFWQISSIFFLSTPVAVGRAIYISSILYFSANSGISPLVPRIGTPFIYLPILLWSSSIMHTGIPDALSLLFNSFINRVPACPPPTIITRFCTAASRFRPKCLPANCKAL